MKKNFVERRAARPRACRSSRRCATDARAIKNHVLDNLDVYLERFETKVIANGGQVHWCADAEAARQTILRICRSADAKHGDASGKTMIGEEIDLNHFLEANGITPVETDLGEYIIQLRGRTAEPPDRAGDPSEQGAGRRGLPRRPHRSRSRSAR